MRHSPARSSGSIRAAITGGWQSIVSTSRVATKACRCYRAARLASSIHRIRYRLRHRPASVSASRSGCDKLKSIRSAWAISASRRITSASGHFCQRMKKSIAWLTRPLLKIRQRCSGNRSAICFVSHSPDLDQPTRSTFRCWCRASLKTISVRSRCQAARENAMGSLSLMRRCFWIVILLTSAQRISLPRPTFFSTFHRVHVAWPACTPHFHWKKRRSLPYLMRFMVVG